MKKQRLLKTLLVAAGLFVGASAWADVTPVSQDYSGGVADWTSGSTDRYTVDMNAGGYLTVNAVGNGNNGTTITGETVKDKAAAGADFASSDDFTMIFDLQLTGGNNQASYFHVNDASNGGGVEAETGHMLTLHQTAANGTTWQINGATDQTVTLTKSTWYTFKLSKSGSKLYLTVTPTAGGDDVFAQQSITVISSKGGLGNLVFQTKRYYSYLAIDNVVLRTIQDGDVPTGTATTYTIKYKNESDVTIKDDIVVDAFVNDVVTASAAQMTAITYNEKKYIYKSGNDDLTCVADAASNVITLIYREANTYTYKVTSNLGTVLANSSDFEGETVSVTYPKYELDGTELKEAATSGTNTWYAMSYILSANVDETITYNSVATPIEDVVFYVEGESITGATKSTSNNASIRNSNGAVGYAAGTAGENDLTITTLTPGKYQIVANVHTSSSGAGTSTFILGANSFAAAGAASQYNTTKTSDEFTIYENTALKLQAGGGAQNAVDYVYVIKTGDITEVPVTISAAGMATYVPAYNLDFTDTDIKAYTAEVKTKATCTLTEIKKVPAGTPVLLIGTTANIPVAATTDAVGDNDLVAGTATTATDGVATTDGGYTNMILNNIGGNVGFYFANGQTVATDRAYLHFDSSLAPTSDSRMTMVFGDGETTGVKAIDNGQLTIDNSVYDLQGRRIGNSQFTIDNSQLKKGLYIVNGRKYLVK